MFKSRFPWSDVTVLSYVEIECLKLDLYTKKIFKNLKSQPLVQAKIHKKIIINKKFRNSEHNHQIWGRKNLDYEGEGTLLNGSIMRRRPGWKKPRSRAGPRRCARPRPRVGTQAIARDLPGFFSFVFLFFFFPFLLWVFSDMFWAVFWYL